MTVLRAPKGKRYIVSSIKSGLDFGTIIDDKGINYDSTAGDSLDLIEINSGEALLKVVIGKGLSHYCFSIGDSSVEGPAREDYEQFCSSYEQSYILPIGSKYSWEISPKKGYKCKINDVGSLTLDNSTVLKLEALPVSYDMIINVDDNITGIDIKINNSLYHKDISSKSVLKEKVNYGDEVILIPYFKNGYEIKRSLPEKVIINKKLEILIESSKVEPLSALDLIIDGDWENRQHILSEIDTSGLKFYIKTNKGDTLEVFDVKHQPSWEGKIGNQECIFTYVFNGKEISSSKSAYISPREVKDKYGNIWLCDEKYHICGTKGRFSSDAETPIEAAFIEPYSCMGILGVKSLTISDRINNISEGAFKDCLYLEEVIFKYGHPINIGRKAFSGCINLKSLDFLACGNRFSKCVFGDENRDVWEGCDKLEIIKITKDNFSKSLGKYIVKDNEIDCFKGPGVKYDIKYSGQAVVAPGIKLGSPLIWEVYSLDDKLYKALSIKRIPDTNGGVIRGYLYSYESGNYLKGTMDLVLVDKWDFSKTGSFTSILKIGEGNSAFCEVEVLGLGSDYYDFDRIISSGYKFEAFNDIGRSLHVTNNLLVKDVLYPNLFISKKGQSFRYLDFLKPIL